MQKLPQNVREKVDDGAAHEVRVWKIAQIRVLQVRVPGVPKNPRGTSPGPQTRHSL